VWAERVSALRAAQGQADQSPHRCPHCELRKAKQIKAPIVVSKLDRLSRDVHFISCLMTSAPRGDAWNAKSVMRSMQRLGIAGK
jgi:hypothetical protein